MPSQLILPPQKFRYKDITDQFPVTGNPKKKVFFQAELRAISGGNATFGVIAYPSWKDGNKWIVGTKVSGTDTGAAPKTEPLTVPVGFANNEVLLSLKLSKKNKKKKRKKRSRRNPRKGRWTELMRIVRKVSKDPKLLEEAELVFEARISENPHLEYDVTLDMGGTILSVETKPSPPAPPAKSHRLRD